MHNPRRWHVAWLSVSDGRGGGALPSPPGFHDTGVTHTSATPPGSEARPSRDSSASISCSACSSKGRPRCDVSAGGSTPPSLTLGAAGGGGAASGGCGAPAAPSAVVDRSVKAWNDDKPLLPPPLLLLLPPTPPPPTPSRLAPAPTASQPGPFDEGPPNVATAAAAADSGGSPAEKEQPPPAPYVAWTDPPKPWCGSVRARPASPPNDAVAPTVDGRGRRSPHGPRCG